MKEQVVNPGGVQNALDSMLAVITKGQEGLAIIVTGDTCTQAVPSGGYAYIKNNTHGLAEGLYRNKSGSAFPTSGGTANSTVFEAVSEGGLNELNNKLTPSLSSAGLTTTNCTIISGGYAIIGTLVVVNLRVKLTSSNSASVTGFPTYDSDTHRVVASCRNATQTKSYNTYISIYGAVAFETGNNEDIVYMSAVYIR